MQSIKQVLAKAQRQKDYDMYPELQTILQSEGRRRSTRDQNGKYQAGTQYRLWWDQPSSSYSGWKQWNGSNKPTPTAPKPNDNWHSVVWKIRPKDWTSELSESIFVAEGPDMFAALLDEAENDQAIICVI